ncbi:unnamed protein product [Trichogramma brassicae]|uniref:Uncharacterized protein n=1 Tax=Trichogramma brassicae TaxID=86971 RepID=A0A6H5ILS4_9HYME|nr:unnamed protein product [Trichogramma brassicae]
MFPREVCSRVLLSRTRSGTYEPYKTMQPKILREEAKEETAPPTTTTAVAAAVAWCELSALGVTAAALLYCFTPSLCTAPCVPHPVHMLARHFLLAGVQAQIRCLLVFAVENTSSSLSF